MKKLLFVTWDGSQTNYVEGLFMPIFHEINKSFPIEFHVMQFTWGEQEIFELRQQAAKQLGIHYTVVPVLKKLLGPLGSLYSLFTGGKKVSNYIIQHKIDIIMPRSDFPARMVRQIKPRNFKIMFDADGLPTEERVDFSGLSTKSFRYKWLKRQETLMLLKADKIVTRSQKSIEFHLKNIGEEFREKFSVVYNGRNTNFFNPDPLERIIKRSELGFREDETVFVYCGSLGPQYGWDEMLKIFSIYAEKHTAKWLILTGDKQFAQERIPETLSSKILLNSVPFPQVAGYLNTADVAFAIRKPTISMQGVAPIKLGEYLLMGLPTIASKGIGDTDLYLTTIPYCFIYNHNNSETEDLVLRWLEKVHEVDRTAIRKAALSYFSLEAAAQSYIYPIKDIINNKSPTKT